MKRQIITSVEFNIEYILYPLDESGTSNVAAATYKGYNLPDGPLLPADKRGSVMMQQEIDYECFIEDIEDFLTDNCELKLIYKNKSDDYSRYYSFLAQDDEGNTLFKYRLRLRVSNHKAHSTKQQKVNKAKEEQAVKPHLKGKKPIKYVQEIIVNDQTFESYLDAFVYICDECERWLKIMKR